ncbi:hypothetical protein GCM10020221_28420 [Streptomyces thioluteus]|uniref:Uncharacterized protein n=1 Tax=Streptomyces thioluteus TaxID=66431 RepID=A0ABN3WXV2_STRTU
MNYTARSSTCTAALAGTEARLADLDTARKVTRRPHPAGNRTRPARNQHRLPGHRERLQPAPRPGIPSRELHELLGMPTHEASVNNHPAAASDRLTRQGFLTQPERGRYQNGLNVT